MPRFVYKLIRDVADSRDMKYSSALFPVEGALPSSYDLRTSTRAVPAILDQGNLGSCGPNEISNALRYCMKKQGVADFQPSRLFMYWFTRILDGSPTSEDSGISIRNGFKSIAKNGACDEAKWPYDISKYAVAPPSACVQAAETHTKNFKYVSVPQNLTAIKSVIASGFPVVIGITVYESLESDEVMKTGIIPMPDTADEDRLGGHCVALYGYDDKIQRFVMMNTWGTGVGQKGWFTLPYAYVTNPKLAADFWCAKYFN